MYETSTFCKTATITKTTLITERIYHKTKKYIEILKNINLTLDKSIFYKLEVKIFSLLYHLFILVATYFINKCKISTIKEMSIYIK